MEGKFNLGHKQKRAVLVEDVLATWIKLVEFLELLVVFQPPPPRMGHRYVYPLDCARLFAEVIAKHQIAGFVEPTLSSAQARCPIRDFSQLFVTTSGDGAKSFFTTSTVDKRSKVKFCEVFIFVLF